MNTKTFKICMHNSKTIPISLSGFTETNTLILRLTENSDIIINPTFILNFPTIEIDNLENFVIDIEPIIPTTYISEIICGQPDCTGTTGVFISDGNTLYVGNKGTPYKSWIPFTLDFEDVDGGIHLISASIILNPDMTIQRMDGTPCKIKIGCDNIKNSASPTSWGTLTDISTLSGKTMSTNYYSGSDVISWSKGELKYIDITSSVQDLLGTDAITWTNGSTLAIILNDDGSSSNQYRAIVSKDASTISASAPTLRIMYATNTYDDEILDTFIQRENPTSNYYDSEYLYVGSSGDANKINRILMKSSFSGLPADTSVTSASLVLYLESAQSSGSAYLEIYPSFINWDLNGASWIKQYGTKEWDNIGAWDGTTSGVMPCIADNYMQYSATTISLDPLEQIYTEADRWINNGAKTKILMRGWDNQSYTPLMKFDFSTLPTGATITAAKLWVYITKSLSNISFPFHRVTEYWTEMGSSTGNRILNTRWAQGYDATLGNLCSASTVICRLSPSATGWISASMNLTEFGFLINNNYGISSRYPSRDNAGECEFYSKEATNNYHPYMEISYTKTPDNFSATNCGSLLLTSSESSGSKLIKLNPTVVEDWIDTTSGCPNYGFIGMMNPESYSLYTFTSSQGVISENHPKIMIEHSGEITTFQT